MGTKIIQSVISAVIGLLVYEFIVKKYIKL